MKTQKLLKILTLAIGFLTAGFSFGLNGDIFEIKPCDENGLPKDYGASITKPLTSGDAIYFNVRLIGRDYHEGTTSFGRWYLEHKGSADEILDSLSAPLMLGIYVSGKVQYAELHKCLEGGVDGTSRFTDLVFKYVTKPGDVALPIVLQTSGGPASDVLFDDASYMIYNTGKWALKNAHGDTCNLWYWEASEAATAEIPEAFWRAIESPDDPSGERTQDSSLAKCNFYVQTVDFDDTWQIAKGEADELWRSVHERSTITADGLTPKLKAIAAPTEKVTLYVWSDNEEAVFVKSSELVDLQNSNTPDDIVKTHVGTITIAGGQAYADFQIEGANGGQGRTANLILSPWKNYNYSDATGARIIDYVKVPVKCLEPLPPTITVETDRQIAYANGNYMVYGAVLSVYLSEAYTADMVVKITPTLSDGNAAEMGDYLRFSETQTEVTALPDYQIPTVTIPAGLTAKKQLYVFILRGDTRTSGTSRIVFTPSVEDATAQSFIKNIITAGMQVVAEAPVIIQPTEASKFYAICGEDTPLELEVSDTFADSSDVDTGYQIWVKYRNGDTYKKLDGAYYIGEGGALYLLDENATGVDRKTTIRPVLNYPTSSTDEIPHKSQIKIKSPISGKESVVVNFDAIIKEARKSFVIETNDTYEFHEGEQGSFQITLSEPNDTGNTIYAFLKASDNIKAGMLSGTPLFVVCDDTDLTKTRGLAINKNNSETSKSKIKFLDGLGDDAGGLSVQFEVVLCSTSTYDKDKILPGYDSNYLNLTVYNEEPIIKRLEMNGIESEVNGFTYPNKYPKGMMREFVAVIDDKGAYDKTTTEVGEEFQCKWTIKREGMTYGDPITLKGNPANNPLEFNFPQAGKWTIRLQVKDKDMDDWAETDYEVHVNILDNPYVEITSDEAYAENEKSKTIKVGLSYWDANYFDTLKVKVTVDNWVAGKENYGRFILDGAFKSTDPADGDNVYYVDLRNAAPVDIRITELDGTENSSLYGFKVAAEVVSTTVLPTSGESANTYYIKAENKVLINNIAPVCEMIPEPSTNRWVVSGGVDKTHPLNWKVRSDVINDFTGLWEGVATNGVKVSIFGPVNATEFYVEEAASDTFYPDFGDMQGDVDVTFLFEDKDGGSVTYVYQYKVRPSKFLITSAHGPSGGLTTSPLSRKYALLDTLGEGHTYAKEVTFSSADNFSLKWNCGNRTYAEVYAFGYKVANPIDDGKLDNGLDIPIKSNGSHQPLTGDGVDFYNYPLAAIEKYNERVDSFFYCWLIHTMDKDGKTSSSILGDTFSPEGLEPGKIAKGRVPLPTEETKDGNYINTEVEAIFAKEYLPEDNLGDINLDGIPDVFAHKEWGAGNMIKLASGGEEVNNNLINLAKFNGDGDSLPKVYIGGNGNLNYAPIGPEFTARLEIRGFHEGLNNFSTSQARFCDMGDDGMPKRNKNKLVNADELLAWRAFKKAQWETKRDELLAEDPEATVEPFDEAMLPTNATDLAEWSPEPSSKNFSRMDPTVEDTDGDGFPDGWEYYLWYTAHVTARVPNSTIRYERFNFNDILVGTEISPDEVEERFNPCVELSSTIYKENPDFDNDGLSDLEELVIGTNPCHWDTDGDGMCDGWEVMVGLDPLEFSDRSANADGDFMAYIDLAQVPGVDNQDGTYTFYPLLVRGKDYSVATVEDEDGNEKIDPSTFTFLRDIQKTRKLIVKGKIAGKTETDEDIPMYYGREKDSDIWGRKLVESMTLDTADFKMSDKTIEGVKFELNYVLLHDQVRIAVGFDPRTGWNSVEGLVAARWKNSPNSEAGSAVNTIKYRAYDEYLLMKYRREIKNESGFDEDNPWGTILCKTTNPSVIKVEIIDTETDDQSSTTNSTVNVETSANVTNTTGVVSGLLDKAFKESGSNKSSVKGHGADTDGNGVPDGWELYMGRNPSLSINANNVITKPLEADEDLFDEGGKTFDGDKLSYVMEYAGVDSCNAYRDCPSIYNNHPSISGSGWYNKFFPTNPGGFESAEYGYEAQELRFEGADTDGDGIDDDKEFSKFCIDFYNAGNWHSKLELTFIYGKPVDDGTTCIRGGGLNPCTIDTDLDGIPDGWEMQHAGVPVDASAMKTVAPWHLENPAIERILGVKIAEGTFVADGIYKTLESDTNTVSVAASDGTNTTSNVVVVTPDKTNGKSGVYIAGGMDPTWAGDAKTDYHNEDKLLGTVRDVDFDHDGLQNYQEYLIQAVRHLRYDDISTPLMGRLLTESSSGSHRQEFKGYVPFDAGSATNFVAIARRAARWDSATINSRVNFVKDEDSKLSTEPWTEDGWRNLGYFASPVRHWDAATLSGNAYMFPLIKKMAIHSSDSYPVAGYASSDPRMADTDGDGMDDYYEMFHGLNPILGNDADRVEDSEWGYLTAKQGDIISLTYQMGGATESEDDSASTISISAYRNEWTHPSFRRGDGGGADIGAVKAFDPVLYPWLQGTAMVDSDGDGMRNEEERILANVADPMPRHTDPTPLWFTERTTPISFVSQYYRISYPVKWRVTAYNDTPGISMSLHRGNEYDEYMFSFEEGEGYDTDGDFKYDGAEVIKAFSDATDPLKFDDPDRRQALWLDGVNSFVMSPFPLYRVLNGQDLLKQFTVECWVRPEIEGKAQTIIDRSFYYYGDHVNSDVSAIRANFRIGLYEDGSVYGMFDNNKALESGAESSKSCQFVKGRKLNANEWAHIALTFDGDALKLYIDGEMASVAHTDLIPANGVYNIVQDPGNFETFPADTYRAKSGALFIGARPVKAADVAGDVFDIGLSAFRNYREFFGGYVDEVRVWDGARTAAEIKDNYLKRFGFNEATQNRDEVLKSFLKGGTRNNNDGMPSLPTELLFHYNFVTLPGAVNASDVAKTPAGFNSQVVNAAAYNGSYGAKSPSVATDINVAWWAASGLRSTVYNDYRVVPWIKNTVEHLTPIDGAALDSFMYTDQFGFGYTEAIKHGLQKYTFNNTAQPYSSYYLHYGFHFGAIHAEIIADQYGEVYSWGKGYSTFTVRSLFSGSTDLLPLGGAFAKTCPKMWDGAVADAWELTGSDADADGLADWWELLYANGIASLSWDSIVERDGVKMSAGEAYKLDIFAGMQPGGDINADYASNVDTDNDFLPDWWERVYGDITKFSNTGDADGDGLSDYLEYFLSVKCNYGVKFSPINAKSANEFELDYFFKVSDRYIGEMFTDHDMIEDTTEALWTSEYIGRSEFMDRNIWDALADQDEDGWSNFAEARHNDFSSRRFSPCISHYYLNNELNDMPIPVLDLTLRYNGPQVVHSVPIQVEVYSDAMLQKPDVRYMLKPGLAQEKSYHIGAVDNGVMRGNLAPGHVLSGQKVLFENETVERVANIKLQVKDLQMEFDYIWYVKAYYDPNRLNEYGVWINTGVFYTASGFYESRHYYRGSEHQYNAALDFYGDEAVVKVSDISGWMTVPNFKVVPNEYYSKGEMFVGGVKIGDIDLISGEFVVDFAKITDKSMLGLQYDDAFHLESSIFSINYATRLPVEQSNKLRVHLGEADTGHVKEGKNTIVAYYDLNEDAKYTPGEPMGTAVGVDVGWRKGTAEIELTDVSPVITRSNLVSGETDRNKHFGASSPDIPSEYSILPEGSGYQRLRVVRAMINGQMIDKIGATNVVVDKVMYLGNRDYLHEGDILSESDFDLDWDNLPVAMMHLLEYNGLADPTEIAYAIIFGDDPIDFASTNKFYTYMTVRRFDALDKRAKPIVLSPNSGANIPEAYPTFKWKMENGNDTYTAFKVQILEGSEIVWDSGIRRAPALNEDGEYVFKADAYVGDELERGKSYSWRVSMYNAKFQDDLWSNHDGYVFTMTDTEAPSGYFNIPVCVKYFGPKAIADASQFVVEAFTTPDFTGTPVARAFVTTNTLNDVTAYGVAHTANVEVVGLPVGEYYLRAYADMGEGNRKRDDIESWGYACQRGMGVQNIYRPLTIKITGENAVIDMVDIYIEDVDVNGNKQPDADISYDQGFDGDEVIVDADGDGIPDDFDGDGIADWAEYFITEQYSKLLGRKLMFSPIDDKSDNVTADYLVEIFDGLNAGEIIARDEDYDGLPEWWEDYARKNYKAEVDPIVDDVNWNTIVTYNGNRISAGLAFVTDVATIKNNAALYAAYKATGDVDGNDIPDWWEIKYNIVGLSGDVDSDNDGLTNREEFYLSEAYDTGMTFSPVDPKSANGVDLDYLVKIKNSNVYAVEIFYGDDADHDGLPDWWEYHVRTTYFADSASAPEDITWDMVITYNGKTQTAGEFFKEDIATNGLLEILENYKETSDIDGDYLADWWEKKYGIFTSSAEDDNDDDGLTNWEEFLLSEMYETGLKFSPVDPQSINKPTIDAFVKFGELEAHEIFIGGDNDFDMLPDYWEFYALQNYKPALEVGQDGIISTTELERDGVKMTALKALIEDIQGGTLKTILDKSDTDGDYMPYWWEKQYGILEESGTEDHDGDGLDNWAEYVLSEIFDLGVKFDPTVAKSANEFELDYFFKIGELYAGEIFSDHDFIEDKIEDSWGKAYANRYEWDALSDNDEDGWSNWSEARYGAWAKMGVSPWITHITGDTEIKDFPIPALNLTIRYHGDQSLADDGDPLIDLGGENGEADEGTSGHSQLVILTYTDDKMNKPDARYVLEPGAEQVHYSQIGLWENKVVRGTLTPGHINSAKFYIEFAEIHRNEYYTFEVKDLSDIDPAVAKKWPAGIHSGSYEDYIYLYNRFGADNIIRQSGQDEWGESGRANYLTVTQDYTGKDSYICLEGKRIGEINLRTGEYSLDLGAFAGEFQSDTVDLCDCDVTCEICKGRCDGPCEYPACPCYDDDNRSSSTGGMKEMMYRLRYVAIVPELSDNKLEVYLGVSQHGYVKEGKNTIVAFFDLNNDKKYTPGEPFGTVTDVDVGWRQGKAEIELTDVSPIISRIDLETGIADRSDLFGQLESHDRSNTVGRLMINKQERVRVVRRYTVLRSVSSDGKTTETLSYLPPVVEDSNGNLAYGRVVLDKVLTKSQRAHLMEGDFLVNGELDIDWTYLYDEAINHKNVINENLDLTHIVYEVILGDGELPKQGTKADTVKTHQLLLVRRYDSKNARPTPQAISAGVTGIEVHRGNPVFTWKLSTKSDSETASETAHNGYTAFRIEIRQKGKSEPVWTSGYLPVPARDSNGYYTFESDAYIGDKLKNFETYTWRVSMYNAKFKADQWSNELEFKMNVPEDAYRYASVPVCVKYFGPDTVASAADFVVEAFTTPDFTGKPVARSLITNVVSVTESGVNHTTNAVLNGLEPGRYFIRAYADLKINGALERCRDSFESWGYACHREESVLTPFAPTEFNVTDMNGFEKPIDIYIEDVDTNGNSLPDAWEYVKNDGKLNVGTTDLDEVIIKALGINKVLTENLQNKVNTTTRANGGNNYIFRALSEPAVSALALGFNPEDVTVNANGSIQVESKVESVEIKSVSFDVNGNVVIEVDGKLNTAEGDMNGLGFIKVESETSKTVTCQVLWKSSLSDTEWTVKAEKKVAVGNGAETIDISGVGSEASGFFKVVVTE